mgnify:CR=1 FL=1
MATVTLTFSQPINTSVGIGDMCYYTPTVASGGFSTAAQSDLVFIGTILTIDRSTNIITADSLLTDADLADLGSVFIFFMKDNYANLSSMLGYYSKMKFANNSTRYAELFGVGVDIFGSSSSR